MRRASRILLLSVFVVLLCPPVAIRAQEGLPAQSDYDNGESRVPVFEFHSGFWVNLHHFLYEQGRLSSGLALTEGGGAGAEQTDALADLSGLTPAERADWKSAVAYYAAGISRGDLISDSEQSQISFELSIREGCADLNGPDCQPPLPRDLQGLLKALRTSAPIYRAHWWPDHDRANRAWIEKVAPLVTQMGVDLASQLADIFQEKWPAAKLRVDVVWYAGPLGAYTTLEPAHVTIASHDPRNQGLYSLEVLFHEASHTLAGGVVFAIQQECKRREMLIPRDLWHALLYYTTGEVVRRTLAQEGEAEYTPYAYRYGLYEQRWSDFEHVLAIYWQPYLDGKVDFDHAIEHVIAALA